MAYIIADRIRETSTTTGTGALALAGAATGYRAFSAVCSIGDTVPYSISSSSGAEWETGVGTYSATNTLTRTTVLASSNGGSAVSFSAGAKDIYLSNIATAPVRVPNSTASTSTTTGALTVAGGLGVAGAVNTGGAVTITASGSNALTVNSSLHTTVAINGAAGTERRFAFDTNGAFRWYFASDTAAESGSNAGSNFFFARCNDAGSYMASALTINRATGNAAFEAGLTARNIYTPPVTLTDAATISTDASLSDNFAVTLGGNRTLANPTNLAAGRELRWVIKQDATGSRTLSYGNAFKFRGGFAPSLTSTANAVDVLSAYTDGSNVYAQIDANYAAPAAGFQPSALPGLVFAADSTTMVNDGAGNVAQWQHLYDSSKFLSSPTTSTRPILSSTTGATGNKSGMTCGVGRYMRANGAAFITSALDTANLATSNWTVIFAAQFSSDTNRNEAMVWLGTSAPDYWINFMARRDAGTNDTQYRIRDNALANYSATKSAPAISGWQLVTLKKAGTAFSFSLGGTTAASATYGGTAGFTGYEFLLNSTLSAGTVVSTDGGTLAYTGLLVCNSALTGTDLTNAEAWVKATAGL